MNYGETLTYWYLRLNGFIPLRNFVLHRQNIETRQSADTDLLAVRFPHVHEVIGGLPDDWDNDTFPGWGLDLRTLRHNLAFIVEVKTGPVGRRIASFRPERLQADLRRVGIFPAEDVPAITDHLRDRASHEVGAWTVGKLLVSSSGRSRVACLKLRFDTADAFI
jgi:hypothetical protein